MNIGNMTMKPAHKFKSRKFNTQISGDIKKEEPRQCLLGNGKTGQKMRISMWNVNGIRSVMNKNALNNYLNKYLPDIFCVNETKINKESFDKSVIQIKGYNGYWNFCKCSAGYSGVAIFTKYHPISVFEDLQEAEFSQQGRVITLEYEHFYVVAVYIPSAGGKQLQRLIYKTKLYEVAFHRYCENLKKKGKGVIVIGDMNVCVDEIDVHITPNASKSAGFTDSQRKSFKGFLNKGWIDTFRRLNPNKREYTWWRIQYGNRERNIGKRLDYCLVNEEFMSVITSSNTLKQVKGSDHCPIDITIDLKKMKKKNESEVKASEEISIKQESNLVSKFQEQQIEQNQFKVDQPIQKDGLKPYDEQIQQLSTHLQQKKQQAQYQNQVVGKDRSDLDKQQNNQNV